MTRPVRPLPAAFQAVLFPFQKFFELEAASGLLLLGAAAVALFWANSPWADSYAAIFGHPLGFVIGTSELRFTFGELINDGLMTLFFLVVGMEIKRELAIGELRTFASAILPAIAAVGGMVGPAAIYVLFNHGSPALSGWGVPMATDIAFSIGLLAVLKGRVPKALVVFLTALAIFDDLGGILVIALFYGHGIHWEWLLLALGLCGVLVAFNRHEVRNGVAYAVLGAGLWFCLHEGGIHATIAGVILGMGIPARAPRPARQTLSDLHEYTARLLARAPNEDIENEELLQIEERIEELEPPLNRFVNALHPYVAYLIVPLFALANSGVSVAGSTVSELVGPVPLGVALGLFFGKQVGILGATLLAVRLGISPMPGRARVGQVWGVSIVGGIGFTVALFVAALAYPGQPHALEAAKVGILAGSILSAAVGYAVLRWMAPTVPALSVVANGSRS